MTALAVLGIRIGGGVVACYWVGGGECASHGVVEAHSHQREACDFGVGVAFVSAQPAVTNTRSVSGFTGAIFGVVDPPRDGGCGHGLGLAGMEMVVTLSPCGFANVRAVLP